MRWQTDGPFSGSIAKLRARWLQSAPLDCSLSEGSALGAEKTISLFAIWTGGAFLGACILGAEALKKKRKAVATNNYPK